MALAKKAASISPLSGASAVKAATTSKKKSSTPAPTTLIG